MTHPPLILVTPDIEAQGKEHRDLSISLSNAYQTALLQAGALPVVMPATIEREWIAEAVRRADGVMLTGGDDVDPRLYAPRLRADLRVTVQVSPDGGARDLRELLLIDEVFRQGKPLLAICRGQQVLNVALGGTLVADIPRQIPQALGHADSARRSEIVHEAQLTPGSLLASIVGGQKLGVNSTHHQAVGRVAAPLRVTARSRDGVIEGLELRPARLRSRLWLLSVQFHPERLADRHASHRALFQAFVQACGRTRD